MVLFILQFILEIRFETSTGVIKILNSKFLDKRYKFDGFEGRFIDIKTIDELENNIYHMSGELFSNKLFNYSKIELIHSVNFTNNVKKEEVLDIDEEETFDEIEGERRL